MLSNVFNCSSKACVRRLKDKDQNTGKSAHIYVDVCKTRPVNEVHDVIRPVPDVIIRIIVNSTTSHIDLGGPGVGAVLLLPALS